MTATQARIRAILARTGPLTPEEVALLVEAAPRDLSVRQSYKLDHETRVRVIAMLQIGGRLGDAARLVGMSVAGLNKAANTDPLFKAQLRQAVESGKAFYLGKIYEGAKVDWKAAAWYLERRFRTEWGRVWADKDYDTKPVQVDLQFGDGKIITATVPASVALVERRGRPHTKPVPNELRHSPQRKPTNIDQDDRAPELRHAEADELMIDGRKKRRNKKGGR